MDDYFSQYEEDYDDDADAATTEEPLYESAYQPDLLRWDHQHRFIQYVGVRLLSAPTFLISGMACGIVCWMILLLTSITVKASYNFLKGICHSEDAPAIE